jgi:hypothetical protein
MYIHYIFRSGRSSRRTHEFIEAYPLLLPITVAARSKAWTAFARSNAVIVGSNTTQGMDVFVRVFCVCVVLCVGNGLATGWSPVQGVLPPVYRIKKLKKRSMSKKRTAQPLKLHEPVIVKIISVELAIELIDKLIFLMELDTLSSSLSKSSSHRHHQLLCVSQEGTFVWFFSVSTAHKHRMTSTV